MPWLEPPPQSSGVLRRRYLGICQPFHSSWPWNYHPLHGTDTQTIIADSYHCHKASSAWSVGNPFNNADARFVTSLYCLEPTQLVLRPWLHVQDPTLTVRLGRCPIHDPHSNSSASNWAWSSGSWEERRGLQGIWWHHAVVQHSASLLDDLESDCIMSRKSLLEKSKHCSLFFARWSGETRGGDSTMQLGSIIHACISFQ